MSRRTTALVVAGVCLVVMVAVALMRPVPYIYQRPGVVQDTLATVRGKDLIEIKGRKTYPTDGELYFTTVSITPPQTHISLRDALIAWVNPDYRLVPRALYYSPDKSPAEAEQESALQMTSSQDMAKVAALGELGVEVPLPVVIHSVDKGAPAEGKLKPKDVILRVGGERVRDLETVSDLLQKIEPGESADFVVRRSGRVAHVTTPTKADPEEPGRTIVGIRVTIDPRFPFEIKFNVSDDVGGPSAGLMFALAIVDRLTPGALTGGLNVAGSGEIGLTGRVGGIGGVQLKMMAADAAGAKVFLVPASNCAEAVDDPPEGMRLVRVGNLHGAVSAVQKLADDLEADVPECGEV